MRSNLLIELWVYSISAIFWHFKISNHYTSGVELGYFKYPNFKIWHLPPFLCLEQLRSFLKTLWQYSQTLSVACKCIFFTCCLIFRLRLTCFPQTKHSKTELPSSSKFSWNLDSTSMFFRPVAPAIIQIKTFFKIEDDMQKCNLNEL